MRAIPRALLPLFFVPFLLLSTACQKSSDSSRASEGASTNGKATLVLGAYSVPREAYGKHIIPAFRAKWEKEKGQKLEVSESYMASGAQARAIVGGFEADVASLSLDPDIQKIQDGGLITHDWRKQPHDGIVTQSVVVIGVRKGNPKGISDWADLAKPGVSVLTPNVKTSGGAMWNVLAVYGAILRSEPSEGAEARAEELLAKILANVKIMDSSGRESFLNFERGVGDAIITYENEILVLPEAKRPDIVVPKSTLLIENPVASVDAYTKKHNSEEIAQGFIDFLFSPEAQKAFASQGLRPVDEAVFSEVRSKFAPVENLFTVRDLGGWDHLKKTVFADGGVYDKALAKGRSAGKGS